MFTVVIAIRTGRRFVVAGHRPGQDNKRTTTHLDDTTVHRDDTTYNVDNSTRLVRGDDTNFQTGRVSDTEEDRSTATAGRTANTKSAATFETVAERIVATHYPVVSMFDLLDFF